MTDGKLRLLSTSQAGNVRSEASEHAQKSLIFDDSELLRNAWHFWH